MRRSLVSLTLAVLLSACSTPQVAPVEPPTPYPTYTPYLTPTPLATYTPYPTYTALPTQTLGPTHTPVLTPMPESPTAVPRPTTILPIATSAATDTPVPQPTVASEDAAEPIFVPQIVVEEATGYAKPVLLRPGPGFDVYAQRDDTVFEWTWDGQLKDDEYFQVQIVSRDASNFGEHRGIHAPTKEFRASTNRDLWGHFRDWEGVHDRPRFGAQARIYADWTVAIVKWDGVDPGKIGPTSVEAEPRFIKL